jgi:hypothetical protein
MIWKNPLKIIFEWFEYFVEPNVRDGRTGFNQERLFARAGNGASLEELHFKGMLSI